jgi:galactose mutarotase-like enzyme
MYVLENEFLILSVNPIGAEISSIQSKVSGIEYCWSGDPNIWGSTAPVLFPLIGALKSNSYFYQEKLYSIPKHGFIRHNQKLEVKQSNNKIIFTSLFDEDSLKMYPFEYKFEIEFRLNKSSIEVIHHVTNLDQKEPLYYAVGGHPAFNCPWNDQTKIEDYYLEFEKNETDERCLVTADGLIDNHTSPFLNNTNHIALSAKLFYDDALIFKHLKSRKVSLKSHKSNQAIEILFNDFNYLGIWAKPNAPFVCIEPWLGISDSVDSNQQLTDKEGILKLDATSSNTHCYTINIHEQS